MSEPLRTAVQASVPFTLAPPAARPADAAQVEWPTVLVASLIFASFALLTWCYRTLPWHVALPLLAICLAWYNSLQHETIHGHPTRYRRINRLIGSLPLALWLPYRLYRVTHLQHHRHAGRHLTDAEQDPESFYWRSGTLTRAGWFRRALLRAHCTLAGRLLLGPAVSMLRFWSTEARRLARRDFRHAQIWLWHGLGMALVLAWVSGVCRIPLGTYVLCVVYPSIALNQLRSFAEHRAAAEADARTITVEAGSLLSLLFMNNNLHIAHHAHPEVPWYRLPDVWSSLRSAATARQLVYEGGYGQVAARFLQQPIIDVEHPGR